MQIAVKVNAATVEAVYILLSGLFKRPYLDQTWFNANRDNIGWLYVNDDRFSGWDSSSRTEPSPDCTLIDTTKPREHVISLAGEDITISAESFEALKASLIIIK